MEESFEDILSRLHLTDENLKTVYREHSSQKNVTKKEDVMELYHAMNSLKKTLVNFHRERWV